MKYKITAPKTFCGKISLPSSKSISNRVLIIKALCEKDFFIKGLSDCDDTTILKKALKQIDSHPTDIINIASCGTAMRFLTALLTIKSGTYTLTGNKRMQHRPIGLLVDALRQLGAEIEYLGDEGYPPLKITGGQIVGGAVEILGNVSSQFISALLMLGPLLKNGLQIRIIGDIVSRPYIDLTLWIMQEFGAKASWTDSRTITITPSQYKPHDYAIEKDWSAASYWYEIMSLTTLVNNGDNDNEITLEGLCDGSKQGDTAVRYLFSLLGVSTEFCDGDAILKKVREPLPRLNFNFSNHGDIAQTVIMSCCALGVKFSFTGLNTLRIKETDRITALYKELNRLGYDISIDETNALQYNATYTQKDFEINTYEDHRMAMSFAPLAMCMKYIIIESPEVVNKSYPNFWNDLRSIGFSIDEI